MASKPIFFLSSQSHFSGAQTWIKAGYWYANGEFPIQYINSALFTHLSFAFAEVNASNYQLSIPSSSEQYLSTFATIVKRRNPSVKTLLSVWNGISATGKSISGEKTCWVWPNITDLSNVGVLLDEWRAAINSEPRKPGVHAALYDPSCNVSTDFGISEWLNKGMFPSKLVLGLPYHGYAWKLVNSQDKAVGAPASGPAVTMDGSMEDRKLAGFNAFELSNDENWMLSWAAQEGENKGNKQQLLLKIIFPVSLIAILAVVAMLYYLRRRKVKTVEEMALGSIPSPRVNYQLLKILAVMLLVCKCSSFSTSKQLQIISRVRISLEKVALVPYTRSIKRPLFKL
ncbi:Glycosyl hydrolase family protein with chitinase insertion domain [Hibiscus syriacus]|uniref:Glycosyl hydrolase family protein with chitinase insertion domain n=1 Tax=Hibiscus syriacus TaxID=106335 RepID=A0A6A3C583_HIBSY|nr:Glycosyl hydrolase family protein with chitinase insertion domain [Hibiscus syriacus]